MQIGDACQFRKRILASNPGIKILEVPQFSYMPDQTLGKILGQNLTFSTALPSQNINIYSKILQMTKRLMLWTRNS